MQVLCGQCGKTIEVDDEQAGSTIQCPECHHEIVVPRFDEEPAGEAGPDDSVYDLPDEEEGFAGQAKEAMSRKIQVLCGSCGRSLSVSTRLAGKNARCPACGVKIRIPYPDEGTEEDTLEHLAADESERTEALDAVTPETKFARSEAARRPIAMPPPSQTRLWLVLASIAAGAIAGGLVVGAYLLTSKGTELPPEQGPSDNGGQAVVPPGPKPPVKPPRPVVPKPATRPRVLEPAVEVLSADVSDFAGNGYLPAKPGSVYWQVAAQVKAGQQPLVFNTYGPDVTLTVGSTPVASLGTAPGPMAPPTPGRRFRVAMAPGESQKLTFLFEVPATAKAGILAVSSAPIAEVSPAGAPAPIAADAAEKLPGTYKESPPRNLQPLLRDPVMRAIQTAADQKMHIEPNGGGSFQVSIPAAGVQGIAKPGAAGTYETVLYRDESRLPCKLRPAGEGDLLILYLSDEPFHQITYARAGSGASSSSRPSRPGTVISPRNPRPTTNPVLQPPTEPAEPPTTQGIKSRLPKDHGKKTIFDF